MLLILFLAVVGGLILYAIIQGAVRSGVEDALRNHHKWLQGGE
jgi:hypothetical protein